MAWARNLGAPVRDLLRAEPSGAVVLVGAALVALVWANSPWPRSYEAFWTTELALSLNDHVLSTDLRGFVNEGLMTLFFLVVGLEAKRELDLGELRERIRIGIPVMAALGGMALAFSEARTSMVDRYKVRVCEKIFGRRRVSRNPTRCPGAARIFS